MSFVQSILGLRSFASEDEIKRFVAQSKEFAPQIEDIAAAKTLLIFTTSRQQTWLVATAARLYCVLDDVQEKPTIWWVLNIVGPAEEPRLTTLTGEPVRLSYGDRSDESGVISVDTLGDWLYSKKLFTTFSLEESISRLIRDTRG
jgi:hypothetical protein